MPPVARKRCPGCGRLLPGEPATPRERTIQPDEIKLARSSARLTQAAFGARIGVSRATIARWEAGSQRPYPWALEKLRHAIGAAQRPQTYRPDRGDL